MIVRQALNFAVHLLGGIVVGAAVVFALSRCQRGKSESEGWADVGAPADRPPVPTSD